MSSSKQSRLSRIPTGSKIIPRGSKMMNQSKIKRKSGVSRNSKGSTSRLMESRFMSRMKSSMVGGKYGKSGYRKKGSSKYSTVRENGDPIIYREGIDVTPLPIQIDNINEINNNQHIGYGTYGIKNNEESNCFIPLIDPIYHPMSMSQDDEKKESERGSTNINLNIHNNRNNNNNNIHINSVTSNNNKNKLTICSENENKLDTITNVNEFNEFISKNPSVLDENIIVNLSETDTKILFEMPSLAISNSENSKQERENVIKINKEYEFCLLKHSDKDLFTTEYTQTYNPPIKDQSIYAKPAKTNQKSTQSSQFDIYNSFENDSPSKISQNNQNNISKCLHTQTSQTNQNMIDLTNDIIDKMDHSLSFKKNMIVMERAIIQNVMAEKQMLYRIHSTNDNENANEFDSDDELIVTDETNSKPELKVEIDFNIIDPTKNSNKNENQTENNIKKEKPQSLLKKQAPNEISKIAHLELLWDYSCKQISECETLECTALDFNPLNTDLIVGGYGKWDFANQQKGKIMFWTLRNPSAPSRIYNIDSTCVVSLNFSRIHPYLLSVGLFDGSVAIYDIRMKSNEAILKSELNSKGSMSDSHSKKQSQSSSAKHTTPVWNVLWEKANQSVEKEEKENENENENEEEEQENKTQDQRHKLFSIASDGIIKQWSMKKGFQCVNIMSLKRVSNLSALRGSSEEKNDNTIRSRQASGLCFDFPSYLNNRQYYVGTEDGIIHKCSVSYNEQVLRTYYGHTAPIYRIQCNPFDESKFVSCSADWTINVWSENKSKPLLQLISSNTNQSIVDCCWAPFNSCMFASATEKGILSIWNLKKNKKDAIIVKNTKNEIKQIMFAPNAPIILSAHKNGKINVYRLNNINTQQNLQNHDQQIDNLNQCFD